MHRLIVLIACALIAGPPRPAPTETVLATLPGSVVGRLQVPPNGRHVFATIRPGPGGTPAERGDWALYRDGALVGRYDGPLPRVSYIVESSEPGVELRYSADGEHYAFAGERVGKQFVVVDGVEGPPQDSVRGLVINPAGTIVAYVTGGRGAQRLVVNGRAGVVVDGVERPAPGPTGDGPTFSWSPDSRHLAYVVRSDSLTRYPLARADVRGNGTWPCNPGCYHMVVDGVESPGYFSILPGYSRFLSDGRLFFSAFDSTGWFTVVGRERLAGMQLIGMTRDGAHRAFAVDTTYTRLLVDGTPLTGPGTSCCFYGFSPKGKHFTFINWPTRAGETFYASVDSVHYPGQGPVVFSPNEDHVAYMDGNQVVLDRTPLLATDLVSTRFFFDTNDRYHAFALRGNQLIRVDGRLSEGTPHMKEML
jgi:hypothetical protein